MSARWLLLALAGCGGPTPDDDPVLYRVGEEEVRASEVQARIDGMPEAIRSQYGTPEAWDRWLDEIVRTEVLVAEARRVGLDRDPEVVRVAERAMVLALVEDRLRTDPATEVTEADIAAYYADHADAFVHPEEVRITEVVVGERERADHVLRAASEPSVTSNEAFRELVFTWSEDEGSKARGGDRTLVAGRSDGVDRALVDAAFGLWEPGELSPVIASDEAFRVLRLRQRVPASIRTLDESRARIRELLGDERRGRAVDALADSLAAELGLEVHPDPMARLVLP